MGSPDLELPDTLLFLAVFFRNFQADNSSLRELIKDLQAGISAWRGERVKLPHSPTLPLPVTAKHQIDNFQEVSLSKG